MWYPAKQTLPVTAEPVTLAEVKAQVLIDTADDDTLLAQKIAASRDYVEKYCGVRFAKQTLAISCDCFADMARLPAAPVISVASLDYVDPDEAAQTVAGTVYETRADDLEVSIVLKPDQSWPEIRSGSRILLTGVFGYEVTEVPPAVKSAILMHIAESYEARRNGAVENWTAVDQLLCNYRRGV